ncbi:MAG: CBS domain-containing protein [Candidatus Omnitrophota bacterium]
MIVKNNMQTQILSVKRGTTLTQLLGLFKDFHSFPVVPVVDNDNVLIGIVHIKSFFEIFQPTYQDILMRNPLSMISRAPANIFDIDIDEGLGFLVLVADIMDKNIVKIKENQEIRAAYDLMHLHGWDAIPVVDDQNKLMGIISTFDIMIKIFQEKGLI